MTNLENIIYDMFDECKRITDCDYCKYACICDKLDESPQQINKQQDYIKNTINNLNTNQIED